MNNVLSVAVTSLLLAFATPSAAKTLICDLKGQGNSGWIPQTLIIKDRSGSVTINGPLIREFKGGPIAGKITTRNNVRTTYSWTLNNITVKGRGGNQFVSGFRYRITIQNRSLSAQIWAKPNGYRDQFRGKGQCRVAK